MKWNKYSIITKVQFEDSIIVALSKLGIDAVEIVDNSPVEESIEKEGGYFEELMPQGLDENDDNAEVIFYLENEDKELLARVSEKTSTYGKIVCDISDEADWRDKWKEFFHSFTIGNLLIKPTWEDAPSECDKENIIEIDPGIAFGTGSHETTKMCIKAMQKYIKADDKVLDVGFGSGILSVVALKLGAGEIAGTDIDRDCLIAVDDNFRKNQIPFTKGSFLIGDLSTDKALQEKVGKRRYDIVLANILADIIIKMDERLYDALKPGGILIASGIIDFKENAVTEALEKIGFRIVEINHDGEWVQITAKKEK